MKLKKTDSLALAKLCYRTLDEKKAGDLRLLDVSEQSSITDYLVLATGTSEPHLRALRIELEKALDAEKAHIVGMETGSDSGWIVIDAFDVMVHLFSANQRSHYGLENLWKDAVELPGGEVPAAARRAKVKKAPKKSPQHVGKKRKGR